MLGTLVFIIVFSILIATHELGHFLFARLFKVKVETFSLGLGPKLVEFTRKGTKYRLSIIPVGGYVRMKGMFLEDSTDSDAFATKKRWQRFLILFAGPFFNFLTAIACFFIMSVMGEPYVTGKVNVFEDSPASIAGIQNGDVVRSVDGFSSDDWSLLVKKMRSAGPGREVRFEVVRSGRHLEFSIQPQTIHTTESGRQKEYFGFGFSSSGEIHRMHCSFFRSVSRSVSRFTETSQQVVSMFGQLFAGKIKAKEAFGGPVMIYEITVQAADTGFDSVVFLVAMLSYSIGLFNLFPIPVLDGGYIALLALEVVRRKPMTKKAQIPLTAFFAVLLISLMILLTFKDFGCFN